jgi:hypothetical protein
VDQKFCILCKEIVNPRYEIKVTDTGAKTEIIDSVCAECYENLFSSHHNNSMFGMSRIRSLLRKGRKDLRRL